MPPAVTFTRNVTINSSSSNGKVSSPNWTCTNQSRATNPPVLSQGAQDQLVVSVTDSNPNPATSMTLYAIISPAPGSESSDTASSPFQQGQGNKAQTFLSISMGSAPFQFTFPAVKVNGNYELTYVIQTNNGNQFSEDPEFDVNN